MISPRISILPVLAVVNAICFTSFRTLCFAFYRTAWANYRFCAV